MNRFAVAFAAVALAAIGPAQGGTLSPAQVIYVAAGVYNSGGGGSTGTGTSVHCSNRSGKSATVTVGFYQNDGTFAGSAVSTFPNRATRTVSTKPINVFGESSPNIAVMVAQGSLSVVSTETAVYCSAMIVDAASAGVSGVALHMVRYLANPGTTE